MVVDNTIGIQSFDITWDPPQNFMSTPVLYNITANSQVVASVLGATYLHVNNLQPCTMYTINVLAYSSLSGFTSQASMASIRVSTKPLSPPPPQNLAFSYIAPQLSVTWDSPLDGACDRYDIQAYRLHWRCNDNVHDDSVVSGSASSINIDVTNFSQGWCIARMQSCDGDMRCGNFSNEATTSVLQQGPSQPSCFVQTESNSNVNISFTVSQPFIADTFRVEWMLRGPTVRNGSFTYEALRSNIVNLVVERNSTFDFQLSLCNTFGCSLPCEVEFTTIVSVFVLHMMGTCT